MSTELQTEGQAQIVSIDVNVVKDASSQMSTIQSKLADEAASLRSASTTIEDGIMCKGVEQLTEAFRTLQTNIETLSEDANKISKGLTDCATKAEATDAAAASLVNR